MGTDFGPGSLTDSGYPRIIKRWRRGQPLADAVTVFEAAARRCRGQRAASTARPASSARVFTRAPDFFSSEDVLLVGDALQPLRQARRRAAGLLVRPRAAGAAQRLGVGRHTLARGALLVGDAQAYLAASARWHALFTPTATRSLAGYALTRHTVLLELLDNVAGRLEERHFDGQALAGARRARRPSPARWRRRACTTRWCADDALAETYLLNVTDFLTPDSLLLGRRGSDERELLKSRPAFFDAQGMRVEQRFATSKDGTRVPYFVVWPAGAKADGGNPTLLYGYGGFEVPLQPQYAGAIGDAWYARGGVLGGGQHPRRRRVRPGLAPGGAARPTGRRPSTTSSPWPKT